MSRRTKSKGKLRVRHCLWYKRLGKPRLQWWDGHRWHTVATYAKARIVAKEKGYTGIVIENARYPEA